MMDYLHGIRRSRSLAFHVERCQKGESQAEQYCYCLSLTLPDFLGRHHRKLQGRGTSQPVADQRGLPRVQPPLTQS